MVDTGEDTPIWKLPADYFSAKDGHKVCTQCKISLPIESFSNRARALDGKNAACRKCVSAMRKRGNKRNNRHAKNGEKECGKCKETKPVSEFATHKSARDGLETWCRSCKNHTRFLYRLERKLAAIEYKGGCCEHCGYNEHPAVLQFHHLDATEKEMSWTKMSGKRWPDIVKELDKCILLCANCHIIEHATNYNELGWLPNE